MSVLNNDKEFSLLIVDDETDNLTVLRKILGNEYHIRAAKNGENALLLALREHPDLVLLDILLPDEDGFEVCRKLKNQNETCNLPVIFISSLAEVGNERKGFDLGAVDYIRKPFAPEIVKARVDVQVKNILQERAIKELNIFDPLTKLANRQIFDYRFDLEWRRAVRYQQPLALAILDLDKLKNFNATYGFARGDALLIKVGKIMLENTRRPGDCAAKLVGGTFAILLPDSDIVAAREILQSIREEITLAQLADGCAPLSVSIGLTVITPSRDDDMARFFVRAQELLACAKLSGSNIIAT